MSIQWLLLQLFSFGPAHQLEWIKLTAYQLKNNHGMRHVKDHHAMGETLKMQILTLKHLISYREKKDIKICRSLAGVVQWSGINQ